MSLIQIRRVFTHVETILHEFGPAPATPQIRGAVAAVLTNPYAGQYHADILPMMEALNPVGLEMASTLLRAMNMQPEEINSYGKGSIVGSAGELEHGNFSSERGVHRHAKRGVRSPLNPSRRIRE